MRILHRTLHRYRRSLAVVLLSVLAAGCAHTGAYRQRVSGFPGRKPCALCADDVVRIMRRAGFEDSEILEYGPGFRNRIATVGGARIRVGTSLEAIFAVTGDRVQVSSRRTGTFAYDLVPPEGEMLSASELPHADVVPR